MRLEYRRAVKMAGALDRSELIALNVDVIVTDRSQTTQAAFDHTKSIPIRFANERCSAAALETCVSRRREQGVPLGGRQGERWKGRRSHRPVLAFVKVRTARLLMFRLGGYRPAALRKPILTPPLLSLGVSSRTL